ncbi:MAG: capsid cement protein [Chlorobiota bacterium]
MPINTATSSPILTLSYTAGEDLPAYRAINFDGELTDDGAELLGVTDLAWSTGEVASVIAIGAPIMEASGAISKGDSIVLATDGKDAAFGGSGTKIGFALNDAADGGYVKVLIRK